MPNGYGNPSPTTGLGHAHYRHPNSDECTNLLCCPYQPYYHLQELLPSGRDLVYNMPSFKSQWDWGQSYISKALQLSNLNSFHIMELETDLGGNQTRHSPKLAHTCTHAPVADTGC
jgi:hypothetical protein